MEVRRSSSFALSLPQLWAFSAVMLPMLGSLVARLDAIDLAYQVRAGEIMLQTHRLLDHDVWTFTVRGAPWLNQQWLAELIFGFAYDLGGWIALDLLHSILIGLVSLFVFKACRANGASLRLAGGLTLSAFVISQVGLGLRSQLLGVVLFAAALWILSERDRNPRAALLLPLIAIIWANVHGSFFLLPLLIGAAWTEDRINKRRGRPSLGPIGLASLAATLINPFGWRVWEYVFDLTITSQVREITTEWQPTTLNHVSGAIFFLSIVLVVGVLVRSDEKLPWPSVLMLIGFAALAYQARRGLVWWGLGIAPIMSSILSRKESESPPGTPSINIAFVAVMAFAAIIVPPWWRLGPSGDESLLNDAPLQITRELRQTVDPGDRVFNAQQWGSWLNLALPENPIFIDSRLELFPAEVLDDNLYVSIGRQGWQDILDRWRVDVVLASKEQDDLLLPLIKKDPGWWLVFENGSGAIFERSEEL